MSFHVSFTKKLLSYIFPVRVQRAQGMNDTNLELLLDRGQWQLGTDKALYSDGWRYRPIVAAFDALKLALPKVRKVLVLGVGLGSAVMIMGRRRMYPDVTLVDHDKTSLEWAIQVLDDGTEKHMLPVCADAREYMQECKQHFDVVIVDIFNERVVPDFVTQIDFLQQCRSRIAAGGSIIINYIENNTGDWEHVWKNISNVFPESQLIQFGINKVATASGINTA